MYKEKRIACVVLNYNDAFNAIQFVDSIEPFDCIDNIIIVDNCSTDESMDILSKISSKKISVWKSERNGGYGYGNNFGLKIAQIKYKCDIAFICNSDIKVDESVFESIADTLGNDSSIVACSATQIDGFTNNIISNPSWDVPSYQDYLLASLLVINKIRHMTRGSKKENTMYVGCVPGAFLAVNINKFFSVGGYDERVFLFCEESILGARIKNNGLKTVLLSNAYYYHYHSTTIGKSIPKAISRHKLILNSRLFYISEYLNVSKIKKVFARIVFRLSIIEYYILYSIKSI